MFSTVSYDPIPIEDQIEDVFNLDVSEKTEINQGNFAQLGYESAYILINMGSLVPLILLSFVLTLIIVLLRMHKKTNRWAESKLKSIFFNFILAFFEGTLLIFLIMASVNIRKAIKDEAPSSFCLTVAIVILISCLLHFIVVISVLCQKPEKLETMEMT